MNIKELVARLSDRRADRLPIMDFDLLREAAVMVPCIEIDNDVHILLEKRSASVKQPGEICFPGGRVNQEIHEKPVEAAIREMFEETGLVIKEYNIFLQLKSLISPFNMLIFPFVCYFENFDFTEVKLNPDEVSELLTVPLDFFLNNEPEKYMIQVKMHSEVQAVNGDRKILLPVEALELPSFYNKPYGNIEQPVYIWKYQNEKIWGLTARIIVEILALLKNSK